MSLKSFQLALAEIVSSPKTGKAYAADPALLDAKYQLTDMERSRLLFMLQQKGMRINYMLYQSNRITPLSIFMPYTFKVLRPQLIGMVQAFWQAYPKTAFQFREEIGLFSAFLKEQVAHKGLEAPFLNDLILLEDTLNDIRFGAGAMPVTDTGYSLHPSVRLLRTEHDPQLLSQAMVTYDHTLPPPFIPAAESPYLMRFTGRLELFPIDEAVALALESGNPAAAMPQELADLGLVLRLFPQDQHN